MGWECSIVLLWVPRMLTASLLVSPSQDSSGPHFPLVLTTPPRGSLAPSTAHPPCWWASVHVCFVQLAPDVS